MKRHFPARLVCGWLVMATILLSGRSLSADDERAEAPLRFRRIYVPQDRIEDWPKGTARYEPIDAKNFERMAQEALRSGDSSSVNARIERADYSARLENGDLLVGRAEFDVHHAGSASVLMSFGPCGIALDQPRWRNAERSYPARLGLDPGGRLALAVETSGRLECGWSLRGGRDEAGRLHFSLQLPPCTSQQIELELPALLVPVVEAGIVSELPDESELRRRWLIQVAAGGQLQLRLRNPDVADKTTRLNLAKQTDTYHFSARGLELTSDLDLSVFAEPLKQLIVRLSGDLQVVEARLGATQVSWSPMAEPPMAEQAEGGRRIALTFNEPIVGADRSLRLRAVAPLVTQTKWTLPRMRPEGLSWQVGSATLLVPEPLALAHMTLRGGRQSKVDLLPGVDSGETIELQFFSSDGAVEVVVQWKTGELNLDAMTSVELTEQQMMGRMSVDFSGAGEDRFVLEGLVTEHWQVESVVSEPVGRIARWETLPGPGGQMLKIHLARALAPVRPVRVVLSAVNRNAPRNRQVRQNEFRIVQFGGLASSQNVINVRARDDYQLDFSGEHELEQLDPANLDPALRARLDEPVGLLWRDGPGENRLGVTLRGQMPRFRADVDVSITVSRDTLQQSYRIKCLPQASVLDRLVVHFSHAAPGPLDWSSSGPDEAPVTALRWTDQQQRAAGLVSGGETWEVSWSRRRNKPFEILAHRTIPLSGRQPVSLVYLPDAGAQTGTLTIQSEDGLMPNIENRMLKAIPAAAPATGTYSTICGVYRYRPQRDAQSNETDALLVSLDLDRHAERQAIVWQAVIESRYDADGAAAHRALFRIENGGAPRLRIKLPSAIRLNRLRVDDQEQRPRREADSGSLAVDLPPQRRFPTVILEYETVESPSALPWIRRTRFLHPQPEVPVVTWYRQIHAPPGYVVVDSLDGDESSATFRLDWQRRLFGSLLRSGEEDVFDPFSRRSWLDLGGRRQQLRSAAQQQVDRLFGHFGEVLAGEGEQTVAWGEMMRQLAGEEVGGGLAAVDLLVDHWGLFAAGITPETPIAAVVAPAPAGTATETLRVLNLAVVVRAGTIVLTTRDAALIDRDPAQTLHEGVAYWLPGDLSATATAAADRGWPGALPATAWAAAGSPTQPPWATKDHAPYQSTGLTGWTTTHESSVDASAGYVYVVNQTGLRTLKWTIFLAVVAGLVWRMPDRFVVRLGLIAVAAGMALLLPGVVAPLATALLGAIFVALALRALPLQWLRADAADYKSDHSESRRTAIIKGSTVQARVGAQPEIVSLLIGLGFSLGAATQLPAAPATAPLPVHPVLIPINEAKQPVGDTYYVPKDLFEELHRQSAAGRDAPAGWMLTSAMYVGQMEWSAGRKELKLSGMTARYDFEVYRRQTLLRIPLGLGGATPQVGATLDGQAVDPQWDADGRALTLMIDEPGSYRLELVVRPSTDILGAQRRIELKIPALASSQVELTVPPDAPAVEVPSALGRVSRDEVRGQLNAQLGAADRLVILWHAGDQAADAPGEMEVEQLVWLKVQPGSVVVDVRAKLELNEARPRQLRLSTDPHLRLLPITPVDREDAVISKVQTQPGDPQTIVLDFARSISGRHQLNLSFLWTDAVGIGNVRLPFVELPDARSRQRWVAVSLDPSLRLVDEKVPRSESLVSISPAALAERFGIDVADVALAYRQEGPVLAWTLPTYREKAQSTAQSNLALSFSEGNVDVDYSAGIETTDGHLFQHRLDVSEGLEVTHVSLLVDSVESVKRWAQVGREVTVFLTGPVTGPQTLQVRGRASTTGPDVVAPKIVLVDCQQQGDVIFVYRQPDVLVEPGNKGVSLVTGTVGREAAPANFGRFVGAYRHDDPAQAVAFQVRPNRPRAKAVQVTSINREEGQWYAELNYWLEVEEGVMDALQFRLPGNWKGPFEITPAASHTAKPVPGGDLQYITVRPDQAVSGSYLLRIRGPMAFAAAERVRVPIVVNDDVTDMQEFVVLPKQVDLQDVQWDITGLRPESVPQLPNAPSWSAPRFDSYLVVSAQHRAVLASVARQRESARIRLADVHILWHGQDRFTGYVAYDVEPAGMDHVHLAMPNADYRLVQAQVAGVASPWQRLDADTWELPTGSEQLPHRIEIIYTGRCENAVGNRIRFAAPRLLGKDSEIAVERSLWSLVGPADQPVTPQSSNISTGVDPLQDDIERFASMFSLVVNVTSEEPTDVLSHWYRRWAGRLAACKSRIELGSAALSAEDQAAMERPLQKVRDQMNWLSEHLVGLGVFSSESDASPAELLIDDLWRWSAADARLVLRTSQGGWVGELEMDDPCRGRFTLAARLMATICIAGIALGGCYFQARVARRWSHVLWPFVAIFAGGLLAWLLLSPSVLGLVAMAVAVFLAMRQVGSH